MAIDFPSSPSTGDYFTSDVGVRYKWDGDKWISVAGSGTATITVADASPSNPESGQLWWDETDAEATAYMYYTDANSSQWIPLTPAGASVNYDRVLVTDDAASQSMISPLTTTGKITAANFETSGYIRGPASFTIDPATHGDDTGTLIVAGNLQVDGTTTTVNSTTLTVTDKNIVVAKDAANKAAADGAGLTVDCGSDTDATILYDATNNQWDFNNAITSTGAATFAGLMKSGSAQVEVASTATNNLYGGNSYFGGTGDSSGNANASILNTGAATFAGSGFFHGRLDVTADSTIASSGNYVSLYDNGSIGIRKNSGVNDIAFSIFDQSNTTTSITQAGDATFAGDLTVTGTSIFNGGLAEKVNVKTQLAGANACAITDGNVILTTSNEAGNTYPNITGVHSVLSSGEGFSVTVALKVNGSGTINGFYIDSVAQTIEWSGGSAPSAGSAGYDVFTFSAFKTGSGTTDYVVFGAATNYD